jgi:hypothetical protein
MMMKILLVAAAVAVSAQYKSVTFTIYATGDCSGDGDDHQAATGECHKGRGGGYGIMSCTSDGSQLILQSYSDEGCKTAKDKHQIPTGQCIQPPNVTDHSIKIACNKGVAEEMKELEDFENFVESFDKTYENALEYQYRLSVFLKNLKVIEKLNEASPGVYGVGPFADLTEEEFNMERTCGGEWEESNFTKSVRIDDSDWRAKGAVTSVKDQGRCGSCWAFSATAQIEGEAFIKGKPLIDLAVQEIVSCDKKSSGCSGGDPATGFDYVKQIGGIQDQKSYPYTSGGGSTGNCKVDKSKFVVQLSGKQTVSGGESGLGKALGTHPVSICHQTGGWQHYSGGVMTSCSSGGGHCTLAVGYASSGDYWIIKNSWAEKWGNKGYLYLKQGKNLCGITNHMSVSVVA